MNKDIIMDKKTKFLSFLFYIGFAPFLIVYILKNHHNSQLKEHFNRAMALNFINFICFSIFIIIYFFITFYVEHNFPHLIDKYTTFRNLEFFSIFLPNYLVLFSYFILTVLWITSLVILFTQSQRQIPILTSIVKREKLIIFSFLWNIVLIISFLLMIFFVRDSIKLVENPKNPARFYLIYDDMGFMPRWVLTLGFYRIARVVNSKIGAGNVVVLAISKETLKEALHNGEFVFIAVHGKASGDFVFYNKERTEFYTYAPKNISQIGIGDNLKNIYLANCHGGRKKEQWRDVFYPVNVLKFFSNISPFSAHIYWLWYKIPNLLDHEIKENEIAN